MLDICFSRGVQVIRKIAEIKYKTNYHLHPASEVEQLRDQQLHECEPPLHQKGSTRPAITITRC
jgi:hypothetical protein